MFKLQPKAASPPPPRGAHRRLHGEHLAMVSAEQPGKWPLGRRLRFIVLLALLAWLAVLYLPLLLVDLAGLGEALSAVRRLGIPQELEDLRERRRHALVPGALAHQRLERVDEAVGVRELQTAPAVGGCDEHSAVIVAEVTVCGRDDEVRGVRRELRGGLGRQDDRDL